MLNKNYRRIKQLEIQLKSDRFLMELMDEERYISKSREENDIFESAIAVLKSRMDEKFIEITNLKGQTSVYSFFRIFYMAYNRKGVFIMMNNFMEIGKRIIVVGTKAVTLAAGTVVVSTFANAGVEAIKGITLDNLLKKQEEIKMESMEKIRKAVKYAQTGVRIIGAAALVIVATKATKEGI